jgi:hypothetical protein
MFPPFVAAPQIRLVYGTRQTAAIFPAIVADVASEWKSLSAGRIGIHVLGEPRLREALLRAAQPCAGDEVAQLLALDLGEVWDAQEHRGIAPPVQRGEEDAAVVREDDLLLLEVGDPEDEDVVEPLARRRVDGVRARAAVEAEEPLRRRPPP